MNKITKEIWKEFQDILKRYELPYTTMYEPREIWRAADDCIIVHDVNIQINLVIPDFFEDEAQDEH